MVKHALLLAVLAACGSFEDPDIVLDFRVLALSASVPEQIIDLDINNPAPPAELLEQMVPTDICVLLSDRIFDRRLRWSMTLCNLNNDERCTGPQGLIGSGVWEDPELTDDPPRMCATVPVDGNLLAVLLDYLEGDQLRGLGGIYYGVSLAVGGEETDPAEDLYAAKSLRVQPRIPPELQANNNPTLLGVDIRPSVDELFMTLPLERCIDQVAPITVAPGQRVRFAPIEPEGAREVYVTPTIDGGSRTFTESLTYQWLATAGNFSSGRTGGVRDAFGNPPPLFTDWTAPAAKDLTGPTNVSFWFIQRDERLGLTWYESCLTVVP
jgi:hypothetical protein